MTIYEQAKMMKLESTLLASSDIKTRNDALKNMIDALMDNKEIIFEANHKDMEEAKENNIPESVAKRLKFDEAKLKGVIEGLENLIKLDDPLNKVTLNRELDYDLKLIRKTCPIGVIGVIFEARPDALIQIASLCIKSGNCAILKGGSETKHSNKAIFEVIYKACIDAGLPKSCLFQAELRNEISELLECHEFVDLLIPRGSNSFVSYIMNNTKIPVMGHADGICHVYVDDEFDLDKAVRVIIDAKTQYTAACNSTETLLVHENAVEKLMPSLMKAFKENNVEVRAEEAISKIYDTRLADEKDFETEYLDLIISIKKVKNIEEAVNHINKYGSHHTDCIITENDEKAEFFFNMVDSAGVYQNCSTRFADGFRYGFGAEVGISTGKIHARGPVGLEGLVTYKYKLVGNGNIVDDYAKGIREFHFKNL